VIHRVLADGEHRRLRAPDPLPLEEVGVDAGGVVDAALRQLLGDLPCALEPRLDQPHTDALLGQPPRDRRPDLPTAEHDDVLDLALSRREQRAPRAGRARRADHDDPVAHGDGVAAARERQRGAADQREDTGVLRDPRLAEWAPDDVRIGARRDLELDDLHLTVGEDVGVPRGGHPDRARDCAGGLELGRDGEVDVESTLAPEVDVLDVRRSDHDRGPRRLGPGERAGDEVDLVPRGAGDEEVRSARSGLLDRAATRAVRLDRDDVVAVGEGLEPLTHGVDHRQVVLAVQRLDDRRPDLPRPDDDDLHAAAERRRLAPTDTLRRPCVGSCSLW